MEMRQRYLRYSTSSRSHTFNRTILIRGTRNKLLLFSSVTRVTGIENFSGLQFIRSEMFEIVAIYEMNGMGVLKVFLVFAKWS